MSAPQSEVNNFDDPELRVGVKYTLATIRNRITSLRRATDAPSNASGTALGEIEAKLQDYSFAAIFRRHMTTARQALWGGVRYLKVNADQNITPIALARCAIENAGIARWLAEEDNTTIIQRTIERHIDNVNSERRMLNLFQGEVYDYAKAKTQAILKFAKDESIDLTHITNKRNKVEARTLTSIMESLDVKFAESNDDSFGAVKAPWTIASAIVHGAEYPSRHFRGLTEIDDHGQMIGVSAVLLGGFFDAATTTYERAIREYDRLITTPGRRPAKENR